MRSTYVVTNNAAVAPLVSRSLELSLVGIRLFRIANHSCFSPLYRNFGAVAEFVP